MDITPIIITIILLLTVGFGFGLQFFKGDKITYQLLTGTLMFLGITQLINTVLIHFALGSSIVFYIFIITAIAGIVMLIINIKNIRFNKVSPLSILLAVILVCFLTYNFYQNNIGIEYYDSHFYMSLVNEVMSTDLIGFVDYATGTDTEILNINYDFQGFYILWGMILRIYSSIVSGSSDLLHMPIYLYMYGAAITLYILMGIFFIRVTEYFKCNILEKLIIFIIPFLFFGLQFWNEALGFFGNSYRTLIVGVILFELYRISRNQSVKMMKSVAYMLLISSLVSVSSTGFILAVVILIMSALVLLDKQQELFAIKIGIYAIPIIQFAIVYLGYIILIPTIFVYGILALYHFGNYKEIMAKIFRYTIYALPFILMVLSFFMDHVPGGPTSFFAYHSAYDMVHDYFRADSNYYLTINIIIWFTLIIYLFIKVNKIFKNTIIYFIVFYNPLTYIAISNILTGIVFYRLMDILFNYFTIALFISVLLRYIRNIKYIYYPLTVIMLLVFPYQVYQIHLNDFDENKMEYYDHMYKTHNDKVEIGNLFYTYLTYNNIDSPVVISQFLDINAYVPGIDNLVSYNEIRSFKAGELFDAPNETTRVFYPNYENTGTSPSLFIQDTNYDRVCEIIYENDVDYIVVDNHSHFVSSNNTFYFMKDYVQSCEGSIKLMETFKYSIFMIK